VESVVGIDLSGLSRGTKGRTALAQLSVSDPPRLLDMHVLERGKHTDVELLEWVTHKSPRVVAIDAPLTLPHGITCEAQDCERCAPPSMSYLTRDVDRMAGGMSMVMIAGIAFRGIYLRKRLRAAGIEAIEVYPAAAYRAFGLASKDDRRNPDLVARAIAERVHGTGPASSDERDAVAAALAGVAYVRGHVDAIAGLDGEIWVPRG
jgi:predicted nuclease with RNAse H fold